jgi:hypothetical protein
LQLLEPRPPAVVVKTASEAPPDSARSHRSATLAVRVGRNRQDGKTGFARPPAITQRRARHGIWQAATLDPAPSDPSAREVRHVHHPFAGSLCRLGSSSRADRIRFRPATRHPARLHRSLIEIARNIQHAPARFFTAARRRRYHTMRRDKAVMSSVLNLWNESRTNRARIADSAVVGIRSRPHLVAGPATATRSCKPCAAVPPPERANRLTREGED